MKPTLAAPCVCGSGKDARSSSSGRDAEYLYADADRALKGAALTSGEECREAGARVRGRCGASILSAQSLEERWPNFLLRFDTIDVWRADSGVTMPTSTIASVIEYEGRFVAAGTPGSGGQAWTSTDGRQWQPIDRIAAAWGKTQADIVVSPEVIDAGGIGWVAVGSWTGTGARSDYSTCRT